MDPSGIYIIVLLILLFLSALFSATETSYSSLNIIKIKRQAKRGNVLAKNVYKLSKNYSSLITTVLIFNNIVNVSSASIATYIFSLKFGATGLLYATIIMTVLIIIIGEITPKIIAKEYPEKIAMLTYYPISFLMNLTHPISTIVRSIENYIKKKKGITKPVTATEDELLEIVQTIEFEGVLKQDERELIENVVSFDDKKVKDIMTIKEDIVYIYEDASIELVKQIINDHKYSRIPVVSRKTNKVIGILHESDFIEIILSKEEFILKNVIREAIYISSSRRLPIALNMIQKSRAHMAIVLNNLKDQEFIGIVTLEDILEELVGEIYDEYDDVPDSVFEIGLHSFEIDPNILVRDFFKEYVEDTNPPKIKSKTFTGWLKELSKNRIQKGDEYVYENIIMKAADVKDGNIYKLDIKILSKEEEIK